MNIEPESTCYDSRGREYRYVCAVPGGHLVSAILEYGGSYDESPYTDFGKPEFVSEIHPTAPIRVRAEKIVELDSKIAEKQKELRGIEHELTAFKQEEKGLLERLKKHECMKRIDDILSGKITHYAVLSIYTVRAVADERDGYEAIGKYRLLSLSPSERKGTFHWRVNQYSDGSGSDRDVIPCTSEADAIEALKTEMESQWSDWLMAEKPTLSDSLYTASVKYGVVVPKEYWEYRTNLRRTQLEDELAKVKNQLAAREKELTELENENFT